MSQIRRQSTPTSGRYDRSGWGMIGALGLTLAVVGIVVGARAIKGDEPTVRPENVDYLATIRDLEAGGATPVYPRDLPSEWTVTSVRVRSLSADDQGWALGALTGDERFVGLHQSPVTAEEVVEEVVDEGAVEGEPVALTSDLATEWRSFSDDEGDLAYAAKIAGSTVVVYGSASEIDLRSMVARLTTDAG
jgi:hypothetical protein